MNTRLTHLPDWPTLMGESTAAAYLDMSTNHFRGHCPVSPIWIGSRKLYRRADLDGWTAKLDHKASAGTIEPLDW